MRQAHMPSHTCLPTGRQDEDVVNAAGGYLIMTQGPKVSSGIVLNPPAKLNAKDRMNWIGGQEIPTACKSNTSGHVFGTKPVLITADKGKLQILNLRREIVNKQESACEKSGLKNCLTKASRY